MRWFTRVFWAVLALATLGLLFIYGTAGNPGAEVQAQGAGGKKDKKKGTPKGEPTKEQTADHAAIRKSVQSFIDAFEKGDAKALVAHWTENGEYVADDGTTLRGRAAIESEYTDVFANRKGKVKVDVEIDSIRFPSKDTAIEEGYFKVRTDKHTSHGSKYTVLHVREGEKWLMAVVREWPSEGVSIRDLDWLIGSWSAKRDDAEIQTTYEWWGDKAFLRANFSIKAKGKTITGFQMIGKDAVTGQIRSWAFDPDGSFAEASWSRSGKKWMQDSAAVLSDGSVLAATHILTRIDDDTFTFQAVQRSLDGAELADIPPVRVQRVK